MQRTTVGLARDVITPPFPTGMSGFSTYVGRTFVGVHDDVYVRALVIEGRGPALLIISMDLCFHDFDLAESIKDFASERHAVERDYVFVTYTHTHSGPVVRGYRGSGDPSDAYEEFLLERIQSCIDRAFSNRFQARIEYGATKGNWNINRRGRVNGEMRLVPNPVGSKDDSLQVLLLRDADGGVRGLCVNYACHPVTLRGDFHLSSDFPGRICQLLEARFYGSYAMFLQGAGGDSRPLVTVEGDRFVGRSYAEVEEMAGAISQRVCQLVWEGRTRSIDGPISAKQFKITLPLAPFPRSHLEKLRDDEHQSSWSRRNVEMVLEAYDSAPDSVDLPAGVIHFGDSLAMAYMGGEPCHGVKRNLEPLFPGRPLMFMGYGDTTAYVPTDQIIREGGYEGRTSSTEYGLKGPFAEGVDARFDAAFREHTPAAR